ncbi:MAG: hypothetical protein QXI58_04545 [Candidatus Micrarchaeia archaeon]
MKLEYPLFYASLMLELVIGYWYNVLAEKLPEPGSSIILATFLILLCIIFDSIYKLGRLVTGEINLLDIAPGLIVEWCMGVCLLFSPLFYAVTFSLPNIEFFVVRSYIMVIAWFIPYIYTFKIMKEEQVG